MVPKPKTKSETSWVSQKQLAKKIAEQRILNSLAFGDMHGRFDAVDTAHYKTFKWLFDDNSQESNNECVRSAGELFTHWLSSGQGIFHISGKLGSGKSTLMKFLCDHSRTETELSCKNGQVRHSTTVVH